MTETNFQNR